MPSYEIIDGEIEAIFSILRDVDKSARVYPAYDKELKDIYYSICTELREYQSKLSKKLRNVIDVNSSEMVKNKRKS